jgi:hypothetical protein
MKVEHLLKILHVRPEAEDFVLVSVVFDGWIDRPWLIEEVCLGNGPACDSSVVNVIENQLLMSHLIHPMLLF